MKFSKEIIEIFDYLGEKMGVAIDWTSSSAMPYLEELFNRYINWEIATSIVWIIAGFILLIIAIYCLRKFKPAYENHKKDYHDDSYAPWLVTLIASSLIAIPIIFTQVFDIVRCIYLPELQLYNYLTALMQ